MSSNDRQFVGSRWKREKTKELTFKKNTLEWQYGSPQPQWLRERLLHKSSIGPPDSRDNARPRGFWVILDSCFASLVIKRSWVGRHGNNYLVSTRGKKSEKSAENQFRDLRPRDRANMGSLTALMTDSWPPHYYWKPTLLWSTSMLLWLTPTLLLRTHAIMVDPNAIMVDPRTIIENPRYYGRPPSYYGQPPGYYWGVSEACLRPVLVEPQ